MATTKHIIKNTRNEVKVLVAADAAGIVTVTLAELALPDENVESPVVNLSSVDGTSGGTTNITRDGTPLFGCSAGAWGSFDLGNCPIKNEDSIVVNFGANGSLVLGLRKVSGYGWTGFNGPEGPQPE